MKNSEQGDPITSREEGRAVPCHPEGIHKLFLEAGERRGWARRLKCSPDSIQGRGGGGLGPHFPLEFWEKVGTPPQVL